MIRTKVGQVRPAPLEWVPLELPEYVRRQVELSLRRLDLERIDLFQLHRIDSNVPLEDQLRVLGDMLREGKIRPSGALDSLATDSRDLREAGARRLLCRSPVLVLIPGTSSVAHLEDDRRGRGDRAHRRAVRRTRGGRRLAPVLVSTSSCLTAGGREA